MEKEVKGIDLLVIEFLVVIVLLLVSYDLGIWFILGFLKVLYLCSEVFYFSKEI